MCSCRHHGETGYIFTKRIVLKCKVACSVYVCRCGVHNLRWLVVVNDTIKRESDHSCRSTCDSNNGDIDCASCWCRIGADLDCKLLFGCNVWVQVLCERHRHLSAVGTHCNSGSGGCSRSRSGGNVYPHDHESAREHSTRD